MVGLLTPGKEAGRGAWLPSCCTLVENKYVLCEVGRGEGGQFPALKPGEGKGGSHDWFLPMVHILRNEGEADSASPAGCGPSHHWVRDKNNIFLTLLWDRTLSR